MSTFPEDKDGAALPMDVGPLRRLGLLPQEHRVQGIGTGNLNEGAAVLGFKGLELQWLAQDL